MDIPWSALGSTANPTGAPVNPFGPGGAYPYGFNFFNPMVGMSFPGVAFPGAGLPFGSFPGGLPFGPFPFTQPSQPEDRAQDEQGDASSPRKHAAGSATTTDAGDVGGAEGAGRFARNSAIQAGTLAPSAVNLAEMLPSTNSLMSFSTAPLHAMRSLHGSVNALPMLDALAAQGASLEFLQGMTSSMSAAMLQAGSPKHTSPINGHAALTGGYDDASRSMPAPASLAHSKSSNALGSLFNGAVAGGLAAPPLAIAPLAAGMPEAVHATRAAAAGGRRGGEAGSSGNGLNPDQLANNTMAQLQAFLHQSQAVMAPRPSAGKADGGGASARKGAGSNGRQAGGGDTPMRTAGSITGGRRGAGTGRSASNPQLGSDGGPSSSRGRAGLSAGGSGGMGMPRISSLQALVEVAAAACEDDGSAGGMGTTNGSMAGTESADDLGDDRQHGDEGDMKRLKRKQSNRESARRSRLKKQAEADALTRATSELQAENSALRAALAASQGLMNKLVQEKAELIDVVRGLGQEVSNELEWTVPVIHMPPFGKTSTGHQ